MSPLAGVSEGAPGAVEASSTRADGPPEAVAGAEDAGSDVEEDAAGAEAGGASGARLAGAAATDGAVTLLWEYPGGSSNIGYSRWIRPAGQVTSIRTSTNGSLIGATLVTFRYGWPVGRFSTEKRSNRRDGAYSMRASRKASGAATRAVSESSSPGCSDTRSISALRTWPSAEMTVSLPMPAAFANETPRHSARIAPLLSILIVLPIPARKIGEM